ncbi:MAG TPA: hypothetical protein VFM23_02835 [Gemmatimonadales bacterium]|nr:hypothetical protein [Gemmatimonadales bacterium]
MLALLLLLQAVPQRPSQLTRFLEQSIGLDAAQLAAVERGEPVAKVLDARDRRDVALFGIITLPTSRAAFTQAARDFPAALRTPNRTQLGIFSTPAVESDMAGFTVSERDAREMKDCKPGDCVMKMPDEAIQRIRADVNWSAPDLAAQLSAYGRRRLVEYVNDYRARGDSAMVVYDDRGQLHVRSSEAFAAQLAESPYVYTTVPSLQSYLAGYPRGWLPDAAEIVYWSEDALPRLRPILSLTHHIVYAPAELPIVTIIASKQIYANHYFETALDLTAAVDRGPGIYLLVLRRFRFDNLPGGILNIRGRAINALRDQLVLDLKRYQAR